MRPFFALACALALAGCSGDDRSDVPTPLQRELSELAKTMEVTHPDLFHDVRRATFRAEAARLADAAAGLSRDELVVGVMRVAALPGPRDGHTAVYPFDLTRPAVQRKLVVLTGRSTFSAAGDFVADVDRHRILGVRAAGGQAAGDAGRRPRGGDRG